MWCVYLDNNDFDILEVVENGIKMKNSTQITQRRKGYLKAGTYTLVSKINGVVKKYTFTTSGTNTNINDGVFNFAQGSGIWRFGLINSKYDDHIEYIDLWEGNIDYPHVKNKYWYDFMECQRYVFVTTDRILAKRNGQEFLDGFNFPIVMAEEPEYQVLLFQDSNNNDKKSEFGEMAVNKKGVLYIYLKNPTSNIYQYTILFSCEPL